MRRAMSAPIVMAALVVASTAFAGPQTVAPAAKGGLAPPPAIFLPYGAKVVTELNFSDQDVLAVIKQLVPVLGDFAGMALKSVPQIAAQHQQIDPAMASAVISSMDFKALGEAVAGVKNVRILVATYRPGIKPDAVLQQLQAGVAKIGSFRKLASDMALLPGPCAFYAEANGNGYLAFAYDPQGGVLYAGRVVGRVDVPMLVKWGTDLAKAAMGSMGAPPTAVEEKKE